jgi:hypothetical protein
MLKKRKAEELAAEIQALKSKARGSSEPLPLYDEVVQVCRSSLNWRQTLL